jgi:hypothetical protein
MRIFRVVSVLRIIGAVWVIDVMRLISATRAAPGKSAVRIVGGTVVCGYLNYYRCEFNGHFWGL